MTIAKPTSWDNVAIPIWHAPKDAAITITQVDATAMGSNTPTLTFNIEERAYGSLASAGTDVFAADQVADADGLQSTSFDNAGIAAKGHLVLTTGSSAESGTVDFVTLLISYSY